MATDRNLHRVIQLQQIIRNSYRCDVAVQQHAGIHETASVYADF